jgi:hypothetical protein
MLDPSRDMDKVKCNLLHRIIPPPVDEDFYLDFHKLQSKSIWNPIKVKLEDMEN